MTDFSARNNKLSGMCASPLEFGMVNEYTIVENALTRPHSDGDWAMPPVERARSEKESLDRFVWIL